MKLVDAHCHLEAEEFAGRLPELLDAARLAGVCAWITAAITPEQWPISLDLAKRHPGVHCALGVHPWYIKAEHLSTLAGLGEARDRGAVAIGEIGLDAKVADPPFALQLAAFEAQLRIAKAIDLPVVVHCRGAFDELARTARQIGMPRQGGIVHAFSGSLDQALHLIDLGFSFSMGGSLSYRNSPKRARVLERIYPSHFLLETDAPDIPPVEARGFGAPNTPANILYNLKAASDTLGCAPEEIAAHTGENAARLFRLEL